MTNKTAIVLGSTGLTGGFVTNLLLEDDRYSKVLVFSRKELNIEHPKLEVVICDLLQLEQQKEKFIADEVHVCIGTTNSKTPKKDLYRAIDYGIPVTAADLCKQNNIPTICIMSSIGADSSSSVFYTKTKGEMEEAVLSKSIKNTYLLRPGMILGPRTEQRIGESIGKFIIKLIEPLLIGKLKKYRGIQSETIAKAMIHVANVHSKKAGVFESIEIQELIEG